MAPNGATSRKTPAPGQKARDTKLLGSLFDDLEDITSPKLKPEIKGSLPVVKKLGNWDSESGNVEKSALERKKEKPSLVKRPPSDITKAFSTGRPMVDTPKMLKCNHCKRTVTEHAMPKHIERCLNKKQEKQRKKKEAKDARDAAARKEKGQDSDEEEDGERSAVKGGAASKKRKAADENEEGIPTKKKKKKDEAKAKASKPKAPVDVERQCGVELPLGGQCARSLTCKSHSMGAKRAVAGRSAPYDKLLMEYQRKNAARQQKAAFDANAPDPEDDAVPSGPIDEQAETDLFMAAIAQNWGGAPAVPKRVHPLSSKYSRVRIRNMISSGGPNIFAPASRANGIGVGAFGQAREATDEDAGPSHSRKTSVAPGARSMVPPASRKASVASAIGA